ncbi:Uncharacterised protein [Bordetella pertussis]|nr:Uncharacterised protein [Bordetella pertussis]
MPSCASKAKPSSPTTAYQTSTSHSLSQKGLGA